MFIAIERVTSLNPEFNDRTIKNTLKCIDVKGILSDGDKSHAPIFDSLNVPHQPLTNNQIECYHGVALPKGGKNL
ncbi:MAG: hypothetical protein LBB45_00295 [Methanobrevibacter sp.]|nr:hypothetical protein [Candidatus Methanovirga basalitermitum]